jgi:hypothetical protein
MKKEWHGAEYTGRLQQVIQLHSEFPSTVSFVAGNRILGDDAEQQPRYKLADMKQL